MKELKDIMRDLVDKLNYLTKKYDEGHPEVSDKEWDDLYFQLFDMENKAGFYYEDSPTRQVNYQVVNELKKVEHNHKMLSLDKTKSLDDVIAFSNGQEMVAMTKCDGLTCSLRYIDGNLVSAETRGNGVIGEDVLHNALTIPTIPHKIPYKDELIVDGEIVCLIDHFQDFAEDYRNPRNFAAGSIRLLDSKECASRRLSFVAWDVIKGFDDINSFSQKLMKLKPFGFFTVPCLRTNIFDEDVISTVITLTTNLQIPIDGIVFKFEDISYGAAQGETAHHFKNAIAYKFYDEEYESTLRDIEWSMGRTGVLTPIAIYDDIDIDGSICNRASLHNINIMNEILGNFPHKGQKIWVYKANMIIPQISRADKSISLDDSHLGIPKVCPVCGGATEIITSGPGTTELYCSNPLCDGKLINQLDHFCGKKGLDIRGLSLATLEKLVEWGWVNSPIDIFSLKEHRSEWVLKPGFGEKSVQNILNAIEEGKNCSLDSFIASLGIPMIGKTISKQLVKYFSSYEEFAQAIKDRFDFTQLNGFADAKSTALLDFDYTEADQLSHILNIQQVPQEEEDNDKPLAGKNYVVTGTVKQFKNRAELQAFIEKRGGKVLSGISKNVNYLINNNSESTSAKNVAAKKMGIPILTEAEFLESVN